MKAAVVDRLGGVPHYQDYPDPTVEEGHVLITVEAVAVANVDRAIVPAAYAQPIPEGIEPPVAAVLSSAISAAMSLLVAAEFKTGETVLIQGATGVAGRLAVKIARLLGAGRIVASGRDEGALRDDTELGADVVINTAVGDADLERAFRDNAGDGYDVIVDYLWGRPTELLTRALIPETFALRAPTRLVQIGESAGPPVQLSGDSVRTSGLEIYGAARNAATGMAAAYQRVVDWVCAGELTIDVTTMPLSQIEKAWTRTDLRGTRLVIIPD